jgi:hypothetical protein
MADSARIGIGIGIGTEMDIETVAHAVIAIGVESDRRSS